MDDHERFVALFRDAYLPVLRYSSRRADDQNAQDVAAKVFAIAWRRLAAVPDPALPWLIATARKVLANQHRTDSRQGALVLRLRSERPAVAVLVPDDVEVRQRWAAALSSLAFADQEVLALIAWDGITSPGLSWRGSVEVPRRVSKAGSG